jgi:dihydroorotase-like cyclic amidohydrolase
VIVFRAQRAVVDGAERPAAVLVAGERIEAVLPVDLPVDAEEVLLADDEVLLPGLVDTHVHVNEPGRTEWEGFATATRAAAAGGVTTIVDMPLNSLPPTVDVAALHTKRAAAAGQCAVDVGFWGGAIPGNAGDLAKLHAEGVFGVKCFLLDSGVPEFPPLGGDDLVAALKAVAAYETILKEVAANRLKAPSENSILSVQMRMAECERKLGKYGDAQVQEQIARGVLAPPDGPRTGSPWWRAVNDSLVGRTARTSRSLVPVVSPRA